MRGKIKEKLKNKTFFAVGLLVLFSLALSCCTSSSDAISSFEKPSCLSAISTGRSILGDTAHFGGVQYLSKKVFIADMKSIMTLEHSDKFSFDHQSVCAVAWRGNFSKSSFEKLKQSKKVLIIHKERSDRKHSVVLTIVSAVTGKLLFTIVSPSFPIEFSKIFPHTLAIPGIH